MIYRPDIKPPMWGPPEAVQYAVRHNAERMGISVHQWPFWEGAGSVTSEVAESRNSVLTGDVEFDPSGLVFGGTNSAVTTKKFFTSPVGSIIAIGFKPASLASFQRLFHSNVNPGDSKLYGTYFQTTNSGKVEIATSNGTTAYPSARKSYISDDPLTGDYKTNIAATVNGVGVSSLFFAGHEVSGTYDGGASTYASGLEDSQFGVLCYSGVLYYGAFSVDSIIISDDVFTKDHIAQLHETPYALLMPVARPFIFDMAGGAVFAIDSVTQSQGVTAPAVDQKISVTISSVAQGQTAEPETVSQSHTVVPGSVSQAQNVDAKAVTQLITLSLADVSQSQTAEAPTLAQTHGITTDSVSQGQTATPLTAAQLHEIVTANVGQSQTINSVTVSITGALVIHSVTQSQSAGSVSLDQLISIAVDSVTQGQTIDEPYFASVNLINIDDVSQSQSLGTVSLSQVSALIIDAINQGQQIENVNFSIAEGRVTVTIEARSPGATFNARKPGITFN